MNQSLVSAEQLTEFHNFKSISEDDRTVLAGQLQVCRASRGERLFECSDIDSIDYFLLSGRVLLTAEDGREREVEAGSDTARMPLARLRPRQYTATAQTTIEYFCVDCDLLESLGERQRQQESIDIDYGVIEMSSPQADEAEQMLDSFRRDLEANRFKLQSLPEVALKVRRMLEDPNVGATEISGVLNRDPVIAAKVIRAANSPLYFGVSKCETLRDAVVRLGLMTTRQLVLSFTLRDLFQSQSATLNQRMLSVWQNSLEVASISFVLARHTRAAPPEEALLAGLVSDIGVLAVLNYAENYPQLLADEALLDHWIERLRGEAGAMVLEKWQFPPEVAEVARSSRDWFRCPDRHADLCDLILMANLHSLIGKRTRPAPPRLDQVPAFSKLSLGQLTPEKTLLILEEARAQIAEVRDLLAA